MKHWLVTCYRVDCEIFHGTLKRQYRMDKLTIREAAELMGDPELECEYKTTYDNGKGSTLEAAIEFLTRHKYRAAK